MKKIALLLSLLSTCFWVFCQDIATERPLIEAAPTPQAVSDANTEAGKKVDSLFAAYNSQTPGAAVAIVKDGKVVFQKGYGMADLDHDIPVTPQTVFNIASVSKQFTAFAIYLLASEGRISLEDDIRKYITELPDYQTVIKVKHLLGHTSGLRDQAAIWSLAGNLSGDISTTEQILKLIARQRNLNFTPGTAFSYCNTGYTLLAEIIHRVTGKSFATYTAEKIFKPLGMINTQFYDNYGKVVKNKAESYELINGVYFHHPLNVSNPGPSNLLTTVEDLTKWALNFEHPVVGTPALIKAFNEASYLDNGRKVVLRISGERDTIFHAKGQNLSNYKGVDMITHGGHTAAFRTFMGRFPGERLAIIALSNDENNERLNARWQIADFYIKDKLKEEKPSAAGTGQSVVKPAVVYPSNLQDFAGDYYSDELSTRYTFVVRGNTLIMTHLKLEDIELKRAGEHKFSGSGPETFAFDIEFLRDEKQGVSGFTISNFGIKDLKFVKLK
ncbi:beta-lactamase family protein [Chitinophaga agrisoli]|uniref:Beta-lactamase family protein n=1 Tax=Chitinophaga agrisoli TaxID=2607653 RepID=A0A5B2VZF6_9BACT|nr:serine hydrolase domain-containing protein [Chitinophaga agrisoli]KAA2244841.1 beta-lactamase family protein [Chitinophaga agrisoli]